ncbi:MAG: DNA starvation/stationary phase protection protein [Veillonella sp.]|uniref:Dps family protein n=1 Tax=Veillonella sp. TaxID=1926307 RepID=UPI0025F332CE|nr:DNA starvation/stationary phase protection protein [Veillonella sp.]MBS4913287.1 DNA starvation/stationary phase protection protein [Veillonella sp.]
MKNLDLVNKYLANLVVWNVKLHNLHFNVVGTQFVPTHEYLESVYDEAMEYYDAVAELLKMQGEEPVVRLNEYLKIASLEEVDGRAFSVKEAYEIVQGDFKLMSELAKEIRSSADEEDNFPLANLMEDHLDYYAKQLWFLRATLA